MLPTPAPTSPPQSPRFTQSQQPPSSEPGDPIEDILEPIDDIQYPPPPENNGSAPFGALVGLFEKLQNERKHERRRRLLNAWFDHWREKVGPDLYPVLRLILPQKDRERALYGLKEKNLARLYIKAIPLEPKHPEAIRLLNWKRPSEADKTSGDFPLVLYDVVSKRSSVIAGSLTIEDINNILDELSTNIGKSDIQSRIIQRVYNRSTPEEQRWLVRIILKDLHVAVKETTVFSIFHPDAHDLYNTCSDLKKVAWELWDTKKRLNAEDKEIQLFRPFTPMLCKRPTGKIEESVKEMGGRAFILEEKLDGERMQLHKRGNEFFYCSRKGKDYTYLYGKHVAAGSLTPHIAGAFDPRVEDIVLDGEMLVWDPVSERNLPFGTLKTAALNKSKERLNPRPCFKVFDLLYLNGQSLITKSTRFRKKNLGACVTPIKGHIEFVDEFIVKTAKEIREKMEEVMNDRGEGLVMKHPDSEYVLNGRNKDWIKVKPEYMDNMGETVDVLVVGGKYGSGRRAGGVSSILCGVLDDRYKEGEPKYSTFVRVGAGFSYTDYLWIRDKPWKEYDPNNPPAFLQVAKSKSLEDKPELYLEPEHSFIIKVKAAEITPTDVYHIGYTMRFPRALGIRDDLTVADCVTATALFDSVRSERKRKREEEMLGKPKKKKVKVAKKPSILQEYKGSIDLKDVQVESDLFEGMSFAVVSDPKSRTQDEDKKNILKLIRANGGKIVQVAKNQPGLLVVYDGTTTPYDIKAIMKKDFHDIIRSKWIDECIAAGSRYSVPLIKKYFFHATSIRQEQPGFDEDAAGSETEPEDEDDDDVRPSVSVTPAPASASGKEQKQTQDADADEDKTEDEDEEETDPWFVIKPENSQRAGVGDEEDEGEGTDPESEGDDVVDDNEDGEVLDDEEGDVDEDGDGDRTEDEEDGDDWVKVSAKEGNEKEKGKVETKDGLVEDEEEDNPRAEDVKMGEDDSAMEYDTERIFTHLRFYLDTHANARKHNLSVPVAQSKNEEIISQSFDKLSKLIIDNGGRISTDIDDPKLTHVLVDKRDISRRREIGARTAKPKRRNVVLSSFIEDCLEEETLLDEAGYMP